MAPQFKVAVIGAGGMVGAATVNALVLKNVCCEVLVCDVNETAARGQAYDICDASLNSATRVRYAAATEASEADVVIITAGFPQLPNQTRQELLGKNVMIMASICNNLFGTGVYNKDMKIMVVANPVDTLTQVVQELSPLPKAQVFGSGTYLDSGRLRLCLAEKLGVDVASVDATVMGEHGDRQFVAWSSARVGGQPLLSHPYFVSLKSTSEDFHGALDEIQKEVMRKAYTIIEAKRATYFGVGMCCAHITNAILSNNKTAFPLVHFNEKLGIYCSWPCSVGLKGVEQTFDIALDAREQTFLDKAVQAMSAMRNDANDAIAAFRAQQTA